LIYVLISAEPLFAALTALSAYAPIYVKHLCNLSHHFGRSASSRLAKIPIQLTGRELERKANIIENNKPPFSPTRIIKLFFRINDDKGDNIAKVKNT
jgi:hypothetical protein